LDPTLDTFNKPILVLKNQNLFLFFGKAIVNKKLKQNLLLSPTLYYFIKFKIPHYGNANLLTIFF